MASLGGMSVSAAFGASHLTAALLNVNFDFALVRYDAPPEYLPLGLSLSRKRRRNAEEGQIHATARQLGALFADVLPNISNLSKAYGRRVSEVAECPELNPQGTRSDGPFADFVGADGTSIWAAATSGRGALAAHLLACLIAYMWKPPEAIAIWTELVAARKDRLTEQIHEQDLSSLAFSTLAASRIVIARENLAEWDASARSWLRTADTAKGTEQRRLMLIIDNMNLQVPERSNRYDEVMSVWTKGMTMLENLVSGIAQSATGPEALLGLCSSHIYPDLCVVGLTHSGESTMVSQKDQLVPEGGLLTIGLSHERAKGQSGISWSMPLAHLRYYGKPEERHQQLNFSNPRVCFRQFLLITMGSLASHWTIRGAPSKTIAAFINALVHACSGEVGIPWLIALGNEAQAYLNSSPTIRKAMDRFIMLGRRRPEILAARYHHPSDCFGLCQPGFYLKLMDLDLQVQTLRRLAGEFIPQEMLEHAVIISSRPDLDVVECASVRAQILPGSRQKSHCRWICLPIKVFRSNSSNMFDFDYSPTIVFEDPITQRRWFQAGKDSALIRSMEIICTTGEPCGFFDVPLEAVADESEEIADDVFHWKRHCHRDPVLTLDELRKGALQSNTSWDLERSTHGWRLGQSLPPYCGKTYKCIFRASSISAVYVPMPANDQEEKVHAWPDAVPIELVTSQLREKTLPANWIRKYLHHFSAQEHDRYFKYYTSLEALAGAADVYNTLPNAELDLRLHTSLSDFSWVRAWRINHYRLTREIALSCVTSFETSNLDVEPENLRSVIAISSGNSIYAIETIFCDPTYSHPFHQLRHVIGNVGKSGLSLMISTESLEPPDFDHDNWQLVNERAFDGQYENNFRSTSLHLSMTGYEESLNHTRHGARDREHFYLETVISAYEGGKKVADLDFLKVANEMVTQESQFPMMTDDATLRNPLLRFPPEICNHDDGQRCDASIFGPLTSLDNWFEVLDRPANSAIMRAQGNSLARLALAALCVEKKIELIVFPESQVCWACARETLEIDREDPEECFLFLC